MKHRILPLLLAAVLLLSLSACGKTEEIELPQPGVTGSWEVVPAQAAPLPEDAQAAFDKAIAARSDAMHYMVMNGVIQGRTETTLCPKDPVTRAEAAAMVRRFILWAAAQGSDLPEDVPQSGFFWWMKYVL